MTFVVTVKDVVGITLLVFVGFAFLVAWAMDRADRIRGKK